MKSKKLINLFASAASPNKSLDNFHQKGRRRRRLRDSHTRSAYTCIVLSLVITIMFSATAVQASSGRSGRYYSSRFIRRNIAKSRSTSTSTRTTTGFVPNFNFGGIGNLQKSLNVRNGNKRRRPFSSIMMQNERIICGGNSNGLHVPLFNKFTRNNNLRLFSTLSYDELDAGTASATTDELDAFIPAKEVEEAPYFVEEASDTDIINGDHSDNSSSSVLIKSKPKPGGNWNPSSPLEWSKNFGRRSAEETKRVNELAHLKPGDEDKGYFDVSNITVPGVTMVRTVEEARIVMKALMSTESENVFHACDTEVMEIDLSNVGPVGNGYVTCLSVYSGPEFDYGLGDGPGTVLWVDNLDDSFGVLQEFKPFFESTKFKTVWHNYGFDRHVMWNEGIDVRGFGGDTMHMARLQDTSRTKYGAGQGYSLEALTADIVGRRKKPMKELFGVARLRKDGTAGSLVDVPPVEVLQRDPRFRMQWIIYSAFDAEGTWLLREELQYMLEEMSWVS